MPLYPRGRSAITRRRRATMGTMNTSTQKLLDEYVQTLKTARSARRSRYFENKADALEDKLLKIAERDSEAADQIVPVVEARYQELGLL